MKPHGHAAHVDGVDPATAGPTPTTIACTTLRVAHMPTRPATDFPRRSTTTAEVGVQARAALC